MFRTDYMLSWFSASESDEQLDESLGKMKHNNFTVTNKLNVIVCLQKRQGLEISTKITDIIREWQVLKNSEAVTSTVIIVLRFFLKDKQSEDILHLVSAVFFKC